jgi:ABC-2 type transport system ATP-binding protein
MANTALTLSNVTKTYGSSRGIKNINLTVSEGEVFGFLGPNGAGKSTTIRLILDLIRPTKGKISLLGLDSTKDSVELRKHVGYLSGDMAMDPELTGRQYLDFVANLQGDVDRNYLLELTKRLGCELDKKITNLSRGNKQKIGLVAALMHKPDVLILDEPTSGLDPLVQATFYELIQEHAKQGKTAFISSHVLSEVQHICHRVGFIRDGKLIDVQPLGELMKKSFKSVRIWTHQESTKELLEHTRNVTNIDEQNGVLSCRVTGDPTALLHTLSLIKVHDVLIEEASLEELFMHYYEGKK